MGVVYKLNFVVKLTFVNWFPSTYDHVIRESPLKLFIIRIEKYLSEELVLIFHHQVRIPHQMFITIYTVENKLHSVLVSLKLGVQ